jgi:hypothetical protein
MIDGPGYAGQSMLNGFTFDSPPQGASSNAHGALLWIGDCIVEMAREVDNNTVLGRRSTRRAMAATADRNLELVRPSILEREGNVVGVFHEGHNASRALRVGCPPSDGLGISIVVRGHDIPFERLFECGETRHARQELITLTERCLLYLGNTTLSQDPLPVPDQNSILGMHRGRLTCRLRFKMAMSAVASDGVRGDLGQSQPMENLRPVNW